MILLDTDHLSICLDERDARRQVLENRLRAATEQIACTIVSVEEILRGWLALIHRQRDVRRQIHAYDRLSQLFKVLGSWDIVRFDERAARLCADFQRRRIRSGTMDLKIASVALANDALLITSNLRDFAQVPGLRCEDWLRS